MPTLHLQCLFETRIYSNGDLGGCQVLFFLTEKREIPTASDIHALVMEGAAFATYISCDTTAYRRLMNNAAVKKTLSIPAWLNESAIAAGLNFSQVLQEALKQRLDIV